MLRIDTRVKLAFKIFLSCIFFGVLFSSINGSKLIEIYKHVNFLYVFLSFSVSVVMVVASCYKWKIILDLKEKHSFFTLFRIYFIGYFFSNILPSTVGGDVVRSYYAGKLVNSQAYAAVSVFVERFTGIFFLFILVGLAPLLYIPVYRNAYVFIPALAGVFFAVLTVVIWKAQNPFRLPKKIAHGIFNLFHALSQRLNLSLLESLTNWVEKFFEKIIIKLEKLKTEMQVATHALKNDKIFLYKIVCLTVFFYFLTWVNVFVSFKAFGVEVGFLQVCALVPAIMFVAHIPITLLGNLGYLESVFVFYFLTIGIDGAESLAMGLLLRIKMLCMGVVGLFSYLVYKQKHKPFER